MTRVFRGGILGGMANTMKVEVRRRFGDGVLGAFEAEVSVESHSGETLDGKPFLFRREVSSTSGGGESRYVGVCTVNQVSTLPDSPPDDLEAQNSPFWRSGSTGLLSFPTKDGAEKFVDAALGALADLSAAADSMEGGETVEAYDVSGGSVSAA